MIDDTEVRRPRFDQQTRRRIGTLIGLGLIVAIGIGVVVTVSAFAHQGAADARDSTGGADAAIGIPPATGHALDKVPTEVVREAYIAQNDDRDQLDRIIEDLRRSRTRIVIRFVADTDADAKQLSTFLIGSTGLRVGVDAMDDGSGAEVVTATTPTAPLTIAVAHDLTLRAMEAAWLHGRCHYAGWDVDGILAAAREDSPDTAPSAG